PISGMAEYEKMSAKEKATVRRHFQGWQISQFMQGEQGALICAAKIVTQVPDVDSKFYASTQVIDEARHVESYKRLLEKFGVAYPMTPPLQELIDQVLRDSRWDMTYLGMQVVIEAWRWPPSSRSATTPRTRWPRRSTPTSCRTRAATWRSAVWRCA